VGEGPGHRQQPALAAATAALSVGAGFLPVSGAAAGSGTVATGAAVSVPAASAVVVQPYAGRALDAGRLTVRTGLPAGLLCATLPGLPGVSTAAVLIGEGTGLFISLGFTAVATGTPEERMGRTMGSAELGRELPGDAGGLLLVAAVAICPASPTASRRSPHSWPSARCSP
jgi:hypothetical protein